MDHKKYPAIEEQLFTWEHWGETGDPGSLQFANVTLKSDVGDFKAGTKFEGAFWSSSTGTVAFRNSTGETHVYRLVVSTGEKVDTSDLFEGHGEDCACGIEHDHNPDHENDPTLN